MYRLLIDVAIWHVQGVVKALREQGLLPRVIAGSSVGSIGEEFPCQEKLTSYCFRAIVSSEAGCVVTNKGSHCDSCHLKLDHAL